MPNYLVHYGVKGMQWGVRNEPEYVSNPRGNSKKITGQAKPIYKRGDGLGTGPVGRSDAYRNRFSKALSGSLIKSAPMSNADEIRKIQNETKGMKPSVAEKYVLDATGSKSLADAIAQERQFQEFTKEWQEYMKNSGWESYFRDSGELADFVAAYRNGEAHFKDSKTGKEYNVNNEVNFNDSNLPESIRKQMEIVKKGDELLFEYERSLNIIENDLKEYSAEKNAELYDYKRKQQEIFYARKKERDKADAEKRAQEEKIKKAEAQIAATHKSGEKAAKKVAINMKKNEVKNAVANTAKTVSTVTVNAGKKVVSTAKSMGQKVSNITSSAVSSGKNFVSNLFKKKGASNG